MVYYTIFWYIMVIILVHGLVDSSVLGFGRRVLCVLVQGFRLRAF